MSYSPRTRVRLADDAHCIDYLTIPALEKLPTHSVRLIGLGIDQPCNVAALRVNGALQFADIVTGTLYDRHGNHHNDAHLCVRGLPEFVGEAMEVDE